MARMYGYFKYSFLMFLGLGGYCHVLQAAEDRENVSDESLIEQRVAEEKSIENKEFVIIPHKENYILPITYNPHPNSAPFSDVDTFNHQSLDKYEAKFQISFKMPISSHLIGDTGDLYFAYTNQSWWQVYNRGSSSPFREIVHEPELFMQFDNDWKIGNLTNSLWLFGINHQSNGQSGSLSRSWNRVYGQMVFDDGGPLALSLKTWWRIPERDKSSPTDTSGDDNPDIRHYMGNFEFVSLYGAGQHRFTLLLRDNLEKNNRGALRLSWSYPILKEANNLRFYMQYFNGYGESLVDYNVHTQRIGIGIALNDLL
ncbi:phospholipase A [Vibrio sp. MEBiC08052]|uniref:phospholipase A n=1 Tax=Vibrio sp. MEBiC08052 TaxID=1761910 RepID=UPI0007407314|nr:phospholipase A [Vibrio sp. MEBiC08052]KUI96645.1 hypothetical protein VRK_43400 [Vibrio sp. MEBiC08052]